MNLGCQQAPIPLYFDRVAPGIWATWCGACVSELGGFAEFHQTHPEVELLLVASDSKIQEIRKVFRSHGISEAVIVAGDGDVERFGNNGVPQTYVVDENGHIRVLHYGAFAGRDFVLRSRSRRCEN
jgi:thiol-disulfide isomerase/thioredoxin